MINKQSLNTERMLRGEYERRYAQSLLLHFDKWFKAAQEGISLTASFDSMMAAMEPLWGVTSDIRSSFENVIPASWGGINGLRFPMANKCSPIPKLDGVYIQLLVQPQKILQTLPDMTFCNEYYG